MLQIQVHVAIAAARPFAAGRIRQPRFTDSAQTSHYIASLRVSQQIVLQLTQDLPCALARQQPQPSRKGARFDEYHNVGYTTL